MDEGCSFYVNDAVKRLCKPGAKVGLKTHHAQRVYNRNQDV